MADPGAGATGQAAGLIPRQGGATWTPPLGAPPQVPPSKFRLPRLPPGTIDRPRLTTRLVGSDAALFLVSAPAGSGKSTLLTQWAERDPRRFAYLWLESSENDPAALWTGIIESLRQVLPGFGTDAESMLLSVGGLGLDVVVRRVAAELDGLTDPLVLVLDDYQVIRSTACHESLELLVAQHLRGLHVVLSSRVDRPIRLARTRASGQLTETDGRDLAFTLEETTAVLSQAGPALPAAAASLVQERTEGWPAGVRLVALGLRDAADPEAFLASYDGSSRHVADYLREVVLGPLTEDVRGFLVETSVLRRLSAALCDEVTGRDDSADVLRELDRQNLFVVPLDDHRVWCRYHRLFADLLTEELGDPAAPAPRAAPGGVPLVRRSRGHRRGDRARRRGRGPRGCHRPGPGRLDAAAVRRPGRDGLVVAGGVPAGPRPRHRLAVGRRGLGQHAAGPPGRGARRRGGRAASGLRPGADAGRHLPGRARRRPAAQHDAVGRRDRSPAGSGPDPGVPRRPEAGVPVRGRVLHRPRRVPVRPVRGGVRMVRPGGHGRPRDRDLARRRGRDEPRGPGRAG